MKRFAKKFFIWSGILVLALVLVLVIIAAFFEKQISDRLVKDA